MTIERAITLSFTQYEAMIAAAYIKSALETPNTIATYPEDRETCEHDNMAAAAVAKRFTEALEQ